MNNYNQYKNLVGKKFQVKTDKVVFNISEMKLDTQGMVESKILGIVLMSGKWYFITEMSGNSIINKIPCKDFVGKISSIYFLSKKNKNMDNEDSEDFVEDDSFINELLED